MIAAGWAYTFPVFRSAIAADVYTYAALAGIVTTLTVPALDGVNVQKIGASRGRTTGTMMPMDRLDGMTMSVCARVVILEPHLPQADCRVPQHIG